MKAAVIGAGPGGFAFSHLLASKGIGVALCELPEFSANIEALRKNGTILVSGFMQGETALDLVTDDVNAATQAADLIFIVTHAGAHATIADRLAPLLRQGQSVILSPGYVGGALEFLARVEASGHGSAALTGEPFFDIAETQVMPFACRKTGAAGVRIGAVKKTFLIASSAGTSSASLRLLADLFEGVEACDNLLEPGLNETNFAVHAAIAVTNIGYVQGGAGWRFYRQGLVPAVGALIDGIDHERLRICEKLGLEQNPLRDWFFKFYGDQGMEGASTFAMLSTFPPFADSPGPTALGHRYFSEDIPFGLVPLSGLGKALGVPTPLSDSLIRIGSAACGVDFLSIGRTVNTRYLHA